MANPARKSATPDDSPAAAGTAAAARVASIRQALRAADLMAGKSAEDAARPVDISQAWPALGQAGKRCFTARSHRVASAALGGMQAFSEGPISPAAAERLRRELRESLAHLEGLFDQR